MDLSARRGGYGNVKKREELLSWRAKYSRFGLRRPWQWCFLSSLFFFMAAIVAWFLLGPALREGSIVLPGGTIIHRLQNPEYFWGWVSLYLLLLAGSLGISIWSFRGTVLSHRCMRCEKP